MSDPYWYVYCKTDKGWEFEWVKTMGSGELDEYRQVGDVYYDKDTLFLPVPPAPEVGPDEYDASTNEYQLSIEVKRNGVVLARVGDTKTGPEYLEVVGAMFKDAVEAFNKSQALIAQAEKAEEEN